VDQTVAEAAPGRHMKVFAHRHRHALRARDPRGQGMVEFAMILPLLLVLLLGVADFGRFFQAGIVMESASRAAAEAGALEYLRTQEIRLANPGNAAYYARIHAVASKAACEEARILPNTTYVGGTCPTSPAVLVCVHDADSVDPLCDGSPAAGYNDGLPACTAMSGGWNTAEDSQHHDYVEVRVCYRFTTLFNLHLTLPFGAGIGLGDLYIQRKAVFTVADHRCVSDTTHTTAAARAWWKQL